MPDILQRILTVKAREVAAAKTQRPLSAMRIAAAAMPDPRDFAGAMRAKIAAGGPARNAGKKCGGRPGRNRGNKKSQPKPRSLARGFRSSGDSGKLRPARRGLPLCI